jgi:hypothetical protein
MSKYIAVNQLDENGDPIDNSWIIMDEQSGWR